MDEKLLRMFACDIIQEAGISLRLPQIALTTAQMLLQRVYHTLDYTFDKYPLDITAMAALFLGAKIEEYPKKAREVIDVFSEVLANKLGLSEHNIHSHSRSHGHHHHHHHHRNHQSRDNCRLSSSEHEKVKEELITAERRLLKHLGFNLLSSSPHKIIITYYTGIVNQIDYETNKRLLQLAWNYCNDCLKTDVFIKYGEVVVACACIQLACEDTRMLFPKSTDGKVWYQLFAKSKTEVEECMQIIKDLYQLQKPNARDLVRYTHILPILTARNISSSNPASSMRRYR